MRSLLIRMVRSLPRGFREQFEFEMIEHIEREYVAARSRGRLAAIGYSLATGADLARNAIAERWRPTWTRPPIATVEDKDMKSLLDDWMRDLRHATRALARSPGFTIIAAGTLGLAIGVNAGMFSVVNRVLLNPLPFPNNDRLMAISASAPGSDFPPEFGVSAEFFIQYREQSKLIEDLTTFNSFTNTLRVEDRVERVRMSWPTTSVYSTLGVKPILGRLPVAEDEDRVVVISHVLWQSWFGSDTAVLGKVYDIGGASRTIVGIMGPEFRFPDDGTVLWISNTIRTDQVRVGRFGDRLVARVKPGVTPEALAAELTTLASRLPDRFGGSPNYRRLMGQHRAVVRPAKDQVLGAVQRPLWVLFGAVGIVLLIACANVANLFMVRAEGRQRDLAVRRAIGAARRELVRLQLAETVVVAALAGAFALLLAYVGLPSFIHAAPPNLPRIVDVKLDGVTVLFTIVASLGAALLCGLVPAMRASSPDLTRLREGGRGATRGKRLLRDGLVGAQTALALVLLIGSGLLVKSFWGLRHVDPGYETENRMTFQIAPEGPAFTDGAAYARFHMDFMERIRALPGVESVGIVENVPLNEATPLAPFRTEEMSSNPDAGKRLRYTFAAGDYFSTMGIRVLRGRAFPGRDLMGTFGSVVISRSAAEQLWPGQDPVGRRLQQQGQTAWSTVMGVVEDVKQNNFREEGQPVVYFPLVVEGSPEWLVSSPAYVVKSPRAENIAPEIRSLVKEVAPNAPMYRVFTLERLAADSMVQLSFTMLTLGILSALSLILGGVGLYGVLSYVVAERTREIGVRMALGARADQVRRMVVAQGGRVVAGGVAAGIVAAYWTTKLLGSLLFGVAPLDLMTFLAMSGSMVLVGLVASYLPARRASNVDPIESLRSE
jgi:putative ABC transport system permease protein